MEGSVRAALTRSGLYLAVIERSDNRCQCKAVTTAGCGEPHRSTLGACEEFGRTDEPLLVLPADPMLALHEAAGLGAADLMALCAGCAARRATRVRRWRREEIARRAAADQDALF